MSSSSGGSLSTEPWHVSEDTHIATLTCPFCGKCFTGNRSYSGVHSNYRRHLLTHTHERPYKCRYCGAGFTTKPNMRRHVRFVHPLMVDPIDSPKDVGDSAVVVPLHRVESAKEGDIGVPSELQSTSLENWVEHNPNPELSTTKAIAQPLSVLPTLLSLHPSQPTLSDPNPTCLSSSQDEANVENCHYCCRSFSWPMIRLLHERRCSRRKGLLASKTRNATESTFLSTQPAACVDSQVIINKVEHCLTHKGSTPFDVMSELSTLDEKPKHIFVCENCELEVSSRSKLRRHQRYYCPFRDDAHADPLMDVLVDGGDVGKVNPGMVGSESELECIHAHRLAESIGLKFINNANISSSSSERNMYEERYDFVSSEERDRYGREGERSEDEFMWVYVNSCDATSSVSLNSAPKGRSSPEGDEEDSGVESQVADGDLLDDHFHLDFKRRRSGNKRARRILLKRIRAQQRQLQVGGENNTGGRANSLHYSISVCETDFAQTDTSAETCECHRNDCAAASNTCAQPLLFSNTSLRGSNKRSKLADTNNREILRYSSQEAPQNRGNSVSGIQWSMGFRSRAEALADSSSKRSTHYSYICPFDGCLGRFRKQKYWLAHAARRHPMEWVQYQKRLRKEEDKNRGI